MRARGAVLLLLGSGLLSACTRAGYQPMDDGPSAAADGRRADAASRDRPAAGEGYWPDRAAERPVVLRDSRPGLEASVTGVELCLDGMDNDGDGAVDCADPDCQDGFECVTPPAASFVRGATVAYGTALPPCPDGSPPKRHFVEPAVSSCACSCGQAKTGCSAPQLLRFDGGANCTGTVTDLTALFASSACVVGQPTLPMATSLSIGTPSKPTNQGLCPPSGVLSPVAPFGAEVPTCSVKLGGGCGAGKACVARSAFYAKLCYLNTTVSACQAGFSTIPAFASFTDTRACKCACSTPQGAQCLGGHYRLHACSLTCTAGCLAPLDVGGTACFDVGAYLTGLWSAILVPATAVAGSCAPSGSLVGAVLSTGPVSFCCK